MGRINRSKLVPDAASSEDRRSAERLSQAVMVGLGGPRGDE